MPRSEAYNLYLSVGSGFHNAQKGQTTLPRVTGRGEAACLERKGYARRVLSTRKTRYFSHNSFGTKRDTAEAWFLQELFPRSGSSRQKGSGRGRRRPGLRHAAPRGGAARASPSFVYGKRRGVNGKKQTASKKTQKRQPGCAAGGVRATKKGGVHTPPSKRSEKPNLLHFDDSAGFGQLLLGFFGFFLAHATQPGWGDSHCPVIRTRRTFLPVP